MKNKNFGWVHVDAPHFAAHRRLVVSCVVPRVPAGDGSSFSSPMTGRLVVIAAIVAFVGSYFYGIFQYGWQLGMAIGWLPAITLTWLTAQALAFSIRYVSNNVGNKQSVLRRYHSGSRLVRQPFCCRSKTNAVQQYRQKINHS